MLHYLAWVCLSVCYHYSNSTEEAYSPPKHYSLMMLDIPSAHLLSQLPYYRQRASCRTLAPPTYDCACQDTCLILICDFGGLPWFWPVYDYFSGCYCWWFSVSSPGDGRKEMATLSKPYVSTSDRQIVPVPTKMSAPSQTWPSLSHLCPIFSHFSFHPC